MRLFPDTEENKLVEGGCDEVCTYGCPGVGGAEKILQNDLYPLGFSLLLRVRE